MAICSTKKLMSRSFGLDADGAFKELLQVQERFKNDDLNTQLARDCALNAWRLVDYFFNELPDDSKFKSLNAFKQHIRSICPELAYLQDVCNESRHGVITKYKPCVDETKMHRGRFTRGFSRGFDISRLVIILNDGCAKVDFEDALDQAVRFWTKYRAKAP